MAELLYQLSLRIVPRFFVGLTKVLFSTCKIIIQQPQYLEEATAARSAVAAFWHYSFAFMFYHLRQYPSAVMVSASRDGEYIAETARLMGHTPLRGSSNRGGVKALRAMVNEVKKGRNAGIVADGSQGPARKVQPGCILVAAKTGSPILPIVWAANRYISFKSWDRTVLPMPFSTIVLRYGKPLHVPENVSGDEVERYRQDLEHIMNELYDIVWDAVGRGPHDSKVGTE